VRTELKKIASIQMGYSFRARLEQMEAGEIAVIQMKDLTDRNRVDCSGLMRIDMEKVKEHHLVRAGDLVFRSRGLVTTSAILTDDPGMAVVAAPLLRVRVTRESVLPGYLHWFINQWPAQSFLASHAKGTVQQMIGKDALEKLEIVVPPLERQKAIVETAELADQEQALMKKLTEKRKQYISACLLEMAEGEMNR
jgi:excinuclease UvrABC nuclease subunit